MKWSINAGRIFGIKFSIHATFFLLLAYVFLSDIKEGFGQAGLSVLFVCAIFTCVVIHELSHSLVARRFGREPKSIMLLPIGGVATIDMMPTRPSQEIAISIVGPVTNIVIAIVIGLIFRSSVTAALDENAKHTTSQLFIINFIWVNVALAIFNLIPALPMDGGRILRSILAMKFDYSARHLMGSNCGQSNRGDFYNRRFLHTELHAGVDWLFLPGRRGKRETAGKLHDDACSKAARFDNTAGIY